MRGGREASALQGEKGWARPRHDVSVLTTLMDYDNAALSYTYDTSGRAFTMVMAWRGGNDMPYYHETNRRVLLGDKVLYAGDRATIVFIVEDGEYLPYYKREYWAQFRGGIGVMRKDNELFVLYDPESEEDLEPMS